jgi:hypothetical protein
MSELTSRDSEAIYGQSVANNEITAHTITQRIRSLKKIPPELIPLGVVIAYAFPRAQDALTSTKEIMANQKFRFALFAAAFAMGRKLITDRTLRLTPQREKRG